MTLGERIKTVRIQKKMSQKELAEASGVLQRNISRYELDDAVPSAIALKKLANALHVTTDYLFGESSKEASIKDKDLLEKFEDIQEIEGDTKNMIITFLDAVIRDHKAKKAYLG